MYNTMGKTYGLVSFGGIARRVSQIAKGLGMNVVAYDPFASKDVFTSNGVRRADSLEELFGLSNYISVHTPFMPSTKHMIGEKQFDAMKPGAVFVVTGRGGVVDEAAVKEAIDSGKISFAALDVIEEEVSLGGICNSPLMGMDQVVMTPHIAYYSEDSLVQCRIDAMKQIVEVLSDKKAPTYLVNKDVIDNARFKNNQEG